MISGMKILHPKLLQVLQRMRLVLRRWLQVFCGVCIVSVAGAQGITAADLSALKGAAGLQGGAAGASLGSGLGLPGLMAITVPAGNLQDEAEIAQEDKKQKKHAPLVPNEFQKYVLQTTGQALPLYGAEFFENLNNNNGQFSRSPVSDDYSLGAGDQLLIRVWGSTSAEATVSIDRQGSISFPKLGTLKLAGVKAGQIDSVVKAFFSKYYKDIEVSVSIGKLRKITVFVVGQARNPGSYSLTGQSTLTSALFASGGIFAVIFGYCVPASLCLHSSSAIIVIAHRHGYRTHACRDESRNSWIANLITLGEGWHNNHHARPWAWSNWEKWWEWDVPAMVIWAIKK